mmetsp:Transcript_74987/g.223468  ORF Transcript_74987/g.223468 Transcript_74987/m.223468 type:complete len:252 (-) Transcript_74987:11-766(-)
MTDIPKGQNKGVLLEQEEKVLHVDGVGQEEDRVPLAHCSPVRLCDGCDGGPEEQRQHVREDGRRLPPTPDAEQRDTLVAIDNLPDVIGLRNSRLRTCRVVDDDLLSLLVWYPEVARVGKGPDHVQQVHHGAEHDQCEEERQDRQRRDAIAIEHGLPGDQAHDQDEGRTADEQDRPTRRWHVVVVVRHVVVERLRCAVVQRGEAGPQHRGQHQHDLGVTLARDHGDRRRGAPARARPPNPARGSRATLCSGA